MGWAERMADEQERREEGAEEDRSTIEKIADYLNEHADVTGDSEAGRFLDRMRAIMSGED